MKKLGYVGYTMLACGVGSSGILDGIARWYTYTIKLNAESEAKEKNKKEILKCHGNLIFAVCELGIGISDVVLGTNELLRLLCPKGE